MKALGFVRLVRKAMYGTRGGPQVWQNLVRSILARFGFEASSVAPSLFFNRKRRIRIVTHLDDFLCSGRKQGLFWLRDCLREEFEFKSEILGYGKDEVQMVKLLGRETRLNEWGLSYKRR